MFPAGIRLGEEFLRCVVNGGFGSRRVEDNGGGAACWGRGERRVRCDVEGAFGAGEGLVRAAGDSRAVG